MKTVILIGHRPGDQGAVNEASGTTEYSFNSGLATHISQKLVERGIRAIIVHRDNATQGYRYLPEKINDLSADLIVSLHCNAFDTRATGTETLYYHSSETGRQMAEIFQRHMVKALFLSDRGIKPKRSEDRGGYLLRYTLAPCVIAEPFFIDNDNDLRVANKHYDALVVAYADAIEEIAESAVCEVTYQPEGESDA